MNMSQIQTTAVGLWPFQKEQVWASHAHTQNRGSRFPGSQGASRAVVHPRGLAGGALSLIRMLCCGGTDTRAARSGSIHGAGWTCPRCEDGDGRLRAPKASSCPPGGAGSRALRLLVELGPASEVSADMALRVLGFPIREVGASQCLCLPDTLRTPEGRVTRGHFRVFCTICLVLS